MLGWQSLSTSNAYFIAVAMSGLVLAVTLNVVGLNVGKWLNNVGALASWAPAAALLVLGAICTAGAQTPAAAGPRWDAFIGCWRATLPITQSTPASLPCPRGYRQLTNATR